MFDALKPHRSNATSMIKHAQTDMQTINNILKDAQDELDLDNCLASEKLVQKALRLMSVIREDLCMGVNSLIHLHKELNDNNTNDEE